MRRAIKLVVAGALTVAVGLPLAGADAHRASWRTTSSYGLTASGGEAALGRISSPKGKCVNLRKVKLFQVRRGRDRLVGVDRRSGRPRSDGPGYWVIETNLRSGKHYYARVVRENIGGRRHKHICRSYRTHAYPY